MDTGSDTDSDNTQIVAKQVKVYSGAKPKVKPKVKPRGKRGAATYKSSFKKEWSEIWPFIRMGITASHFRCNICSQDMSCAHQGLFDIKRHISSSGHKEKERLQKSTWGITHFTVQTGNREMSNTETKIRRAEVKVAMTMVQHNVPLAFADHLSPLMKECFRDSPVATGYRSARTKTSCIVNRALAPYYHRKTVQQLQQQPFSLSTDGSNDTGLKKMNPMTVKIFDINHGVVYRFLDMCTTEGTAAATADAIFNKMDQVFADNEIPWQNCIALSLDNASVNMGVRNSIKSRVLNFNPQVYVHGCPAHMVHNNAHAAGNTYAKLTNFDVEDLAVDLAYWFKGSLKRKAGLEEFCQFCDTEYMEMVNYVQTRWLSLEKAVNRTLKLYTSLASYFKSSNESQARFRRLNERFSDPMTEVHLLFYQATLPAFTDFNLLLQRQDPSVHHLHGQMHLYIKKLMSKFVKPEQMKDLKVSDIQYKTEENQLPDGSLSIGFTTRVTLNRLLEGGDVSASQVKKFFTAVRGFFCEAVSYAMSRLPLDEPVLKHAIFVDWHQKMNASPDDVFFFIDRFKHLLPFTSPREQDKVEEEFRDFQVMDKEISARQWKEFFIKEEDAEFLRLDKLWAHLSSLKNPITGQLRFQRLAKVAQLVLCLPHSNADAERVFSSIGLNKTETRNALGLDGTLSSIMTIKMAQGEPCFRYEPPAEVLQSSRSATSSYNKEH
ncbi:uncharacterized protein [Diadema setosum]|uniref:uncharacterized protein n=1 Tax=Diadema setosum TaxID=31175 RepID=UPI003B3A26B2